MPGGGNRARWRASPCGITTSRRASALEEQPHSSWRRVDPQRKPSFQSGEIARREESSACASFSYRGNANYGGKEIVRHGVCAGIFVRRGESSSKHRLKQ